MVALEEFSQTDYYIIKRITNNLGRVYQFRKTYIKDLCSLPSSYYFWGWKYFDEEILPIDNWVPLVQFRPEGGVYLNTLRALYIPDKGICSRLKEKGNSAEWSLTLSQIEEFLKENKVSETDIPKIEEGDINEYT